MNIRTVKANKKRYKTEKKDISFDVKKNPKITNIVVKKEKMVFAQSV